MHPQPLRGIVGWQSAGGRDRLEQGAEHRSHEMVDGQLPEHGAVDGARHLNQHGHELLFGDEYGVVDLEICLFGGVTALQRLARGRIGVWVGAGFHTRLVTLESTFGRVGVLIAYMHLPACVHHLAAHHLKVHADTARGLARVSVP